MPTPKLVVDDAYIIEVDGLPNIIRGSVVIPYRPIIIYLPPTTDKFKVELIFFK